MCEMYFPERSELAEVVSLESDRWRFVLWDCVFSFRRDEGGTVVRGATDVGVVNTDIFVVIIRGWIGSCRVGGIQV